MHGLEIISRINDQRRPSPHPLRLHPRIYALRQAIRGLSVSSEYMAWLYHCLYKYADQFVERPDYHPDDGWDDLEALQQVALGDRMETEIRKQICGAI